MGRQYKKNVDLNTQCIATGEHIIICLSNKKSSTTYKLAKAGKAMLG